jgi:exonuclease SbcD
MDDVSDLTLQPHEINILIGHLTVQGGKTSDSERPLTIGTVETTYTLI